MKDTSGSGISGKSDRAEYTRQIRRGMLDVTPLCVAVLPWGLLAGSFAIEAGLDPFQAQAMSAVVFAGAAQLAASGLFKIDAGFWTIVVTTIIITLRHLLYSISMRDRIGALPGRWRYGLGFLLTDELFALTANQSPDQFNRWYALGAGFWFYLCWNLASFAGIAAGELIPDLDQLGLEFAIAATFIAIVVPSIKNKATLVTVVTALVLSVWLEKAEIGGGLMIATIVAMFTGYFVQQMTGKAE